MPKRRDETKRRDEKKSRHQSREVDPEHDFTYGGDMQHDDADAVQEEAVKGGRPGPGNRPPDEPTKPDEKV